ncbi:MAG: type III secretion system chaperone [Kiritimatiellae bacterium]|nr:type III secretion system chaperone [Kiritimatiellia bacterium]
MAVGSIDLSRVNISLAEFQKMSDGKYNAGEVKLSSETGLKKVNNHVHRLGANKVDISHEEVLAIKEAFVKALSSNGVDKKEINRVRGELGLAPDNGVDTQLHKRSITPLTRQQIREIIDRNAMRLRSALPEGTLRTSYQLYGSLSLAEKNRRAGKREEAAAARLQNSAIDENRSITLFQELIGGTLCQNPETNAYVLMRPVPLARLDGEEAFGAIVEETLAQVERWQKILGGLREAENTLSDQTAEATASFDINAFIQV